MSGLDDGGQGHGPARPQGSVTDQSMNEFMPQTAQKMQSKENRIGTLCDEYMNCNANRSCTESWGDIKQNYLLLFSMILFGLTIIAGIMLSVTLEQGSVGECMHGVCLCVCVCGVCLRLCVSCFCVRMCTHEDVHVHVCMCDI
jgi:hypothetical protein